MSSCSKIIWETEISLPPRLRTLRMLVSSANNKLLYLQLYVRWPTTIKGCFDNTALTRPRYYVKENNVLRCIVDLSLSATTMWTMVHSACMAWRREGPSSSLWPIMDGCSLPEICLGGFFLHQGHHLLSSTTSHLRIHNFYHKWAKYWQIYMHGN
jgi:hypothetical protein